MTDMERLLAIQWAQSKLLAAIAGAVDAMDRDMLARAAARDIVRKQLLELDKVMRECQ